MLVTLVGACGEDDAPPAVDPASAQAAEQLATGTQVKMVESTGAAVAPGLGELAEVALGTPLPGAEGDREDSTGRFRMSAPEPQPAIDPALERAPADSQLGGPLASFDGIAYDAGLAQCCPPDAVGDIGRDHYIEWVNSGLRVYDRAGNPLTELLPGSALFTGLPADHLCRTSNLGDPIVLYDQFADRWVLSQFAYSFEADGDPVGPSYSCLAVSQTADPVAGGWCAYAFVWSDTTFYDYPKLGVWGDYYLLTGIGYTKTDTGWLRVDQQLAAIEREGPLNCDPGQPARAVRVLRTLRASTPITQMLFLPADADGTTPAPADAPPLFVAIWDNAWDPTYADAVWAAELVQAPDGATTIEFTEVPGVAAFDSNLCVYDRPCLTVPEGAPRLDALWDRLMNRAAYRRFDGYGALALTHRRRGGLRSGGHPLVRAARFGRRVARRGAGDVRARGRQQPLARLRRSRRGWEPRRRLRDGRPDHVPGHPLRSTPRGRPRRKPRARRGSPRRGPRRPARRRQPLGRLRLARNRSARRLHLLVHGPVLPCNVDLGLGHEGRVVPAARVRHLSRRVRIARLLGAGAAAAALGLLAACGESEDKVGAPPDAIQNEAIRDPIPFVSPGLGGARGHRA